MERFTRVIAVAVLVAAAGDRLLGAPAAAMPPRHVHVRRGAGRLGDPGGPAGGAHGGPGRGHAPHGATPGDRAAAAGGGGARQLHPDRQRQDRHPHLQRTDRAPHRRCPTGRVLRGDAARASHPAGRGAAAGRSLLPSDPARRWTPGPRGGALQRGRSASARRKSWTWRGDPDRHRSAGLGPQAGLVREAELWSAIPQVNEIPFEPERQYAATFHPIDGEVRAGEGGAGAGSGHVPARHRQALRPIELAESHGRPRLPRAGPGRGAGRGRAVGAGDARGNRPSSTSSASLG